MILIAYVWESSDIMMPKVWVLKCSINLPVLGDHKTMSHSDRTILPCTLLCLLARKDLRRCRAGMLNLAPTSTGSATAIATIFPELKGKLNGLAIRVPMLNSSITDCVFEVTS